MIVQHLAVQHCLIWSLSTSFKSVVETLDLEKERDAEELERGEGAIIFQASCKGRRKCAGMRRFPRLAGSIGSMVSYIATEGINGYGMIGTQLGDR